MLNPDDEILSELNNSGRMNELKEIVGRAIVEGIQSKRGSRAPPDISQAARIDENDVKKILETTETQISEELDVDSDTEKFVHRVIADSINRRIEGQEPPRR